MRAAKFAVAVASVLMGVGPVCPLAFGATRYERVVTELQNLNTAHPALTSLFSLGKNDQGVEIAGIRISRNQGIVRNDARNLLVVGTHHGNEGTSVDVAMRVANDVVAALAAGEATDDNVVYHVIPVLNISGYNANRREESSRTGGTLDPNRDYPDPCADDQPYRLLSTKVLAAYMESAHITAAVTIHGYVGTFTYPWGTYTTEPKTLDNDTFRNLGTRAVALNHYDTGTHGELIYPTVGAFEDWAYYEHGVWVMLLEMANSPNVANDAKAILRFLAEAPAIRSAQHEHTGQCTTVTEGMVLGRP